MQGQTLEIEVWPFFAKKRRDIMIVRGKFVSLPNINNNVMTQRHKIQLFEDKQVRTV